MTASLITTKTAMKFTIAGTVLVKASGRIASKNGHALTLKAAATFAYGGVMCATARALTQSFPMNRLPLHPLTRLSQVRHPLTG